MCETSSDFHAEPAGSTAYLFASGGWYEVQTTGTFTPDGDGSGRQMVSANTVFAGSGESGWVFADSLRGPCEGIEG